MFPSVETIIKNVDLKDSDIETERIDEITACKKLLNEIDNLYEAHDQVTFHGQINFLYRNFPLKVFNLFCIFKKIVFFLF